MTKKRDIIEDSKRYESAIVLYRDTEFGDTKMAVHGFQMELSGMLRDLFVYDPVMESIVKDVLLRMKKSRKKTK